MNSRAWLLVFICVVIVSVGCVAPDGTGGGDQAPASAPARAPGEKLISAPDNAEYLAFLENIKQEKTDQKPDDGNAGTGYMPSPVNLSDIAGSKVRYPSSSRGISRYDLRAYGKVSPVRDAGSDPSTWAFAAYGSLESTQLPWEKNDFSEKHMIATNGFDQPGDYPGNTFISTAYLARWSGPVGEADYPFNSTSAPAADIPVQEHVLDVLIIPDRANKTDNDNIKDTIMSYGAVATTLYYYNSYYNRQNDSYYDNGEYYPNCMVNIVGWDDDYSKYNFTIPAPGNGAFIVRDSQGPGRRANGYPYTADTYYYVSYYDTWIGCNNAVYLAEPSTTYKSIYQYDPYGFTTSAGYNDSTAWFANVFNATSSEYLSTVGFYTLAPDTKYDIFVYEDPFMGGPGNTWYDAHVSGTIDCPGYHTIQVTPAVPIQAGHNFSVAVKVTSPGIRYPLAVERPMQYYSSHATANLGESWVSHDNNVWLSLTAISGFSNSNVCLKAYTVTGTPDVSIVSVHIPSAMAAGSRYNVSIKVKNTGGKPWGRGDGIVLDAVNDSSAPLFGAGRMQLPPDAFVLPGEIYTWNFTMTTPAQTGTYTAKYRMYWEGHGWFGNAASARISVEPSAPDAALVSCSIPSSMVTGQQYNASITMKNTGTQPWTPGFGLWNVGEGIGPTSLGVPSGIMVMPGDKYTWNFTITAPSYGSYDIKYRMARDVTNFFGAWVNMSINVEAAVPDADVVSTNVPSHMASGYRYNVTVTMKNTGNVPWSDAVVLGGVGDSG
jgi:C1A family cysteine protease